MSSSEEVVSIYVYLLDEGVDCWRPVDALPLGDQRFRIVAENPDPENERWQFKTGEVVRCETKKLAGSAPKPRECLVAVETCDAPA